MPGQPLFEGLKELSAKWGWFLALGIALIVLGIVALGTPWIATLASVKLLGWVILAGGIFEAAMSFCASERGGFFMHFLSGILSIVVGVLILGHPVGAAAGLTMLLAAMFLTGGVFRIVAAIKLKPPNWGWAALDGVAMIVLGALIWSEWPEASLWVIGMFIGINLLFRGWAWVMFALGIRQIKEIHAAN